MKIFIVIALTLCSSIISASEQDEIIFTNLTYLDFHDPGYIKLKRQNGEIFEAFFYYHFIELEKISQWKQGALFNIGFNQSLGFYIERISDGEKFKVLFWLDDHPYEEHYDQCQENANSTLDIVECFNGYSKKLNVEYAFLFDNIMLNSELEAQQFLEEFDHKYNSAISDYFSAYYLNKSEGSMYQILVSGIELEQAKNKVNLINSLFEFKKH